MSTEIIENMPFEEYLSLDRLSASALKNFNKSPAYYYQKKQVPVKETKEMKLGTMIHTWMLENSTFHNLYYSMPTLKEIDMEKPEKPDVDLRKKENKDLDIVKDYKKIKAIYDKKVEEREELIQMYLEQANGRIVYPEEVINRFSKLPVRTNNKNEVTVLWEWEGVKCKSRFDMLHDNGIEDLKTINDIFKIDRDFYKFGYHLQAGFYAQAYFHAFDKWPEFFNFTFVSTDENYFDLVTCPISFNYLEQARMECRELVIKFKNCLETGFYPGLSSFEIDAPSWY